MTQCVFCEAITTLNTQMTVSLEDGTKATAHICDAHAEDATPKTVRAAYVAKQQKAEALIAQLKAMGYAVNGLEQSKSGLVIPTMDKPKPATRAAPIILEAATADDLVGDDVVSTDLLDSKSSKGMLSSSQVGNMGGQQVQVAGHASHDLSSVARGLPPEVRKGKAKLVVTEGREGQALVIPEKRVDGMGTTRIKITKKENDNSLQGRFKKMAADSVHHDKCPNFARAGYQNTQSTCPICRGDCIIKQAGKEVSCPKCNGSGVVSVY